MEKRKLAKIPREEASDEMVRFAERAAGTHIVTTKDIEKDLLMVTFYPIRKLKRGKKDAQLRTFFSKNDYISQDLTVEKVKWLTAAYDRMYDISLYEHHWDYKESTGRWTPNMFFWTDADIDRMRSFFKEWSTEKDARDWTAVTRFQDMVKQKRLDERHVIFSEDYAMILHAEPIINYWLDILCMGSEQEKKELFMQGRKEVEQVAGNVRKWSRCLMERCRESA